jgi:hypothetical protein
LVLFFEVLHVTIFDKTGKKWRFGVFVGWVLSNTPCICL